MSEKVHPDDGDDAIKKSWFDRMKASESSCLVFSPSNFLRVFCNRIITSKIFENFILVCIIANSISLAIVDYSSVDDDGELVSSGSARNKIVEILEPFFTWTFVVEMILKIIGMGFVYTKKSYLGDPWNRLDFMVVMARFASKSLIRYVYFDTSQQTRLFLLLFLVVWFHTSHGSQT